MSIQGLLDTMEQLHGLHTQLLETAEQKRHVLVGNQVGELNKLVNHEAKIIRQIADLDRVRVEAINEYLIKRGFRPDPRVTITDLVKMIYKAEEKQQLLTAQKKLVDVLTELKRMNVLNQQLIEQSLAFINYSYDLLLGPPEEDVIYQKPTQMPGALKRNGLFDTRA